MSDNLNVKNIASDLSVTKKSFLDNFFKKQFIKNMNNLEKGHVRISIDGKDYSIGDKKSSLSCYFNVLHNSFFTLIGSGGLNGAAEAYALGLWECDDIVSLIRILIKNQNVMNKFDSGIASLAKPINRLIHRSRKNTLSGSRKNILAHYDLSNDFYKLWLDDTMTYSCGIFENKNSSMKDASIMKLDSLIGKLNVKTGDTILEIGTGWGSFACRAAEKYGCKVITTTISDSQFDYAKKKISSLNLENQITLLKEDYRNLTGNYDKIVSIEMIEAVGHENIPTYFKKVSSLLNDGGKFAMQGITYNDQKFDLYKNSVDFINKYIFPGACLISLSQVLDTLKRDTNLILNDLDDITPHYVRTLNIWREKFLSKRKEVSDLGFDDNFIRLWEFYLVYCEAGFIEQNIGDYQFLFTKKEGLLA